MCSDVKQAAIQQEQDRIMGQGSLVCNSNAPSQHELTGIWNYAGHQEVTRLVIRFTFPTKNRYPSHDKAGVPWNRYLQATNRTPVLTPNTLLKTQTDNYLIQRICENFELSQWDSLHTGTQNINLDAVVVYIPEFRLPNINAYSDMRRKRLSKGKMSTSRSLHSNINILQKISHTTRL
jgi:hypothetical protein